MNSRLLLGACLTAGLVAALPVRAEKFLVYVGTYTGPKSDGILACRFDTDSGVIESLGLAAKSVNPTFLAVHPDGKHLYAANETGKWGDQPGGYVTAFAVDAATGMLKELNQQSSVGGGPCHLVVDGTGRNVLAANYGGGSVVSLPINADGSLRPHTAFIQHTGSSVNPSRQKEPHGHSINVSPDNRFALAADLGTDRVYIYAFGAGQGTLKPHGEAALPPGSGPRHLAFAPDGRHAFVINELLSTLTSFAWDARRGALKAVDSQPTLPAGFSGGSSTAEVRVHPNGRFVYGSNRGHDSIAVFRVDRGGRLSLVEHVSTQGRTPRNFNLDPTGKFLWAGNQGSDSVVVFRVDDETGRLTPTGQTLSIGSPVCFRFVPVK